MAQGQTQANFTLSVVYVSLDRLRANPSNPRLHTEKQIQQIARSIEAFGFNVPLLVDRNLRVIGGHGRLEAAKLRGLTEVPTIQLEHLTEAQAKAFGIADNRLTENSVWNEELLAHELKALSEVELDFSLEATGFEIGEIDAYIEGLSPASQDETDPPDAIPTTDNAVPVTKAGNLWLLKRHRILPGNSLNESSFRLLMQNRKAAMVFVDPPYNVPVQRNVCGLGKVRHSRFRNGNRRDDQRRIYRFSSSEFSSPRAAFRRGLDSLCLQRLAAYSGTP